MQLKAVENIDISTFTATISSILSKLGIEALYHGNVDATDAERAKREISSMVEGSGGGGLQRKKYPHQHVTQMPLATNIVRVPNKDLTDPNTAVEIYFQVGKDNLLDRVMADLLTEMMYEPLYDQIRTKDQFGKLQLHDQSLLWVLETGTLTQTFLFGFTTRISRWL
jgi:nardilysin